MKKITKSQFVKYSSFTILAVSLCVPIPLLIYSSTTNTRNFVLGNYQSYMGPDVMTALSNDYGLAFDYFETAEDVKKLLKKNTIDISNTTSYDLIDLIQENLVSPIDWTKFNLEVPDPIDPNIMIKINNATDALQLFTDPVQEVLRAYTVNNVQINLLDYGIPYFIQDLVFAYRGQEISALSNSSSWADILNVVSQEERFKPTKQPQIVSIDDKRTMYSIPRSIQTTPSKINPDSNASVQEIEGTYQVFSDYVNRLGSNAINLNSDSNAVLNLVAHNQMAGGFMFNGDAIFASNGGDDAIEISEENFHVVKPSDTLVALDLMVINKQVTDQTKVDKTYDVLKDVCLNSGVFVGDIDPDHPSLTFENFDYVNYTPTLKLLYDYAYDEYFDPWQQPFVEVEINGSDQVELPISNLLKSNFNFAWIGFKNSLK